MSKGSPWLAGFGGIWGWERVGIGGVVCWADCKDLARSDCGGLVSEVKGSVVGVVEGDGFDSGICVFSTS